MPVLSNSGVSSRTANCIVQFTSAGVAGLALVDGVKFSIPSPSSVGTLQISSFPFNVTDGSVMAQALSSVGVALQHFQIDGTVNPATMAAGTSVSVRYATLTSGGVINYSNDNWIRLAG